MGFVGGSVSGGVRDIYTYTTTYYYTNAVERIVKENIDRRDRFGLVARAR